LKKVADAVYGPGVVIVPTRGMVPLGALALVGVLFTGVGQAQEGDMPSAAAGTTTVSTALPASFEGPAPPVPPAVIARDGSARVTVRAVPVTTPLNIDGRLDEGVYRDAPSMSDFIQNNPVEGAPASEKTEVWLFFDRDHVYVVMRCWESRPDRLTATEMRRDNTRIVRDDNVAWLFDTFYDRRNGYAFEVSAAGGRIDGQVTNEGQLNLDWNPVWDVVVGRFEGGWAMEAALPFKSLRYRPGVAQVWGFQVRRNSRWRNETSYLTPLSAAQANRGHFRASLAATVVGLEAPSGSRNLEIKPYAIADLTTDFGAVPRVKNDFAGDAGIDLKYGITQNLTADFTVNPDFAQVEADEQQINLTRFSLFFPEKREFFLENQGTFGFGGVRTSGRQAGGTDTPVLFYSRRIGLSEGQAAPLRAGGRLTGRVGRFSLGLLNMQAPKDPLSGARSTSFSVVRVRRDLLRRSSIGAMFTGRSAREQGAGTNEAYGVDGAFGFFDNLAINTHWAMTRTNGLRGDDVSYHAQLDYTGDRYGAQLEHLFVGDHFNPEIGYVRRHDMRRSFAQFRFSPRPAALEAIRKLSWTGSFNYIENGAGRLDTRESNGEFSIELENSDLFTLGYATTYEFLPRPFPIADGVTLPVGGYAFAAGRVGYNFGSQRPVSGNLLVEFGDFFNGRKTAISVSRGRISFTSRISAEPVYAVNWVDLVQGAFTTHLVGTRATYTATPLMFASAFVQYNSSSDAVSANVRFRWEYQPGSELFVVYNEERDTLSRNFPALANRAVIIKVNRFIRF